MNNIVLLKQKKSALNEDSDVGGVVAEWLARSTRVRKDTGFESRWSRSLRNNCGQVVHTHRAQQGRGPA